METNGMSVTKAFDEVVVPKPSKLGRKFKAKEPPPPVDCDHRTELRKLVNQHKRWANTANALIQMSSDRTLRKTKEIIPCLLHDDVRLDLCGERAFRSKGRAGGAAAKLKDQCEDLEKKMMVHLKEIPIYEEFLSHVYGIGSGAVLASYLVSMIRIDICTKPSQLWRYCGNACIDGKAERRSRGGGPKASGGTGTYNAELKCRLWQFMEKSRHNSKKTPKGFPYGKTTKYLKRWNDALWFRVTNGREDGAYHAGRRKATDLFLEDLYIMWRTLEGLPVWPDLYSVRRGFHHGGRPCVNEGKVLTLKQAWDVVGPVEWLEGVKLDRPLTWTGAPKGEGEEEATDE